jgi:RimJ/RimL family protein N-acetyltransferase
MGERSFQLRDGGTIHVRDVHPGDRHLFVEGGRRLSPWSWRARFLMARDHLEEAELDYLTQPDGVSHVALGAVTRDAEGREGPVAVARYLLIPDEGGAAECALVVVDDHQGRGVGRLMAELLLARARQHGVTEFHCEVLRDNEPMKKLLRTLAPDTRSRLVGSVLQLRIPVCGS